MGNMVAKNVGKENLKANANGAPMPDVQRAVRDAKAAADREIKPAAAQAAPIRPEAVPMGTFKGPEPAAQAVEIPAADDAADKLKLTRVEPNVSITETLKSVWNKTAHLLTIAKNIAWKAVIPVAILDYSIQTVNAWENHAKIFAGIGNGLTSVMQQIKPFVAWAAGNTVEVVGLVAGYIALTQAMKFRFKKTPAAEPSEEQK